MLRLRRLGRAAVLRTALRGRLPDAIEHLAQAHRRHHPRADLGILRRAYLLAESAHRGQFRKSGEPYITHPLAVTLILAELGAETTTLTASLLHDTVEDTEVTLDQVRAEFGDEVGHLVDGVTKLEKVEYGAAAESETFRKMLVATGSDVRVMSIKLADRLHNMRTLGVMRPEKQARIARVTGDVLIPLAERLGVQTVKTELEDLVFAILQPEEHVTARELIRRHADRPDPLAEVADAVRGVLREAGIAAEVVIRPRHVLSVHRVRLKRGELGPYDYGRLLILVGENADCYAVLGELHTCFTPVVSEFKDFVAAPKFNLYQSLHTAIALDAGQVAEVLVRTHTMHRVAETGVIALGDPHHAAEGEPVGDDAERGDPTRPGWLSRLLDWQRQAPDPDTFWSALRDELARDREITVFVDAAEEGPLQLPVGATCVDAAYARHGQGAHACIGVRVNGRLATLRTVLHDGDTVQLLLASDGSWGPSPEWLDYATTPAARIPIRRWLDAVAVTYNLLYAHVALSNRVISFLLVPTYIVSQPAMISCVSDRGVLPASASAAASGGGMRPRPASRPAPARPAGRGVRGRGRGRARRARAAGPLLYARAARRGLRLRRSRRRGHRAPAGLSGRRRHDRGGAASAAGDLALRLRRLPRHAARRGPRPAGAAGRPDRGPGRARRRGAGGRGRAAARAPRAAHVHAAAARRVRAAEVDEGHAAGTRRLRRHAGGPAPVLSGGSGAAPAKSG